LLLLGRTNFLGGIAAVRCGGIDVSGGWVGGKWRENGWEAAGSGEKGGKNICLLLTLLAHPLFALHRRPRSPPMDWAQTGCAGWKLCPRRTKINLGRGAGRNFRRQHPKWRLEGILGRRGRVEMLS
jgi:hypothetical protein